MRQGCISLEEVWCDQCHRPIPYAERYLIVDELDGVEVEKGKPVHYCVPCALEKGYAYYKEDEKTEKTLTFFPK